MKQMSRCAPVHLLYEAGVAKLNDEELCIIYFRRKERRSMQEEENVSSKANKQKAGENNRSDGREALGGRTVLRERKAFRVCEPDGGSSGRKKRRSDKIVHPIHDQSLYLSSKHKRKLKEEHGIEPWTFIQKVGDAVFIPAGCPNQVRNLKSCTKVAIDFISPESIGESLRLVEEFRELPYNHEAKENKLEVKKMIVYAMQQAPDDLCRKTHK